MKAKLATLTLVGLVACRLALAQTTTAPGQPASAATTPTSTATTPANVATTPANVATTPANVATTPANVATTPANVAATPATDATTATDVTTPATDATTPATDATTPATDATTPAQVTGAGQPTSAETPAQANAAQSPSAAITLAQANTAAQPAGAETTPQANTAAQPIGAEATPQTNTSAQPVGAEATPQTNTAAQPAGAEATPQANTAAQPAGAATAQPGAVIPLIQFQDVPITTAIENLARQAGINYILDPNVGYGQADDKGVVRAQPNISIRWENLSAEQALNALLNNYGLQLVEDSKTKIARIAKKDPAAPDPLVTKIVQLKFASPSNILASVQSVLSDKRSKVVADVRTSQLVISATEKEQESVDILVARLDTQTKQVLIEAKLLETSKNPRTIKGIDWSGTLEAQNFTFGNGVTTGETTTRLPGTPTTSTTTLPGGRTVSSTTTPGMSQQTVLSTVTGGGLGGLSASTLKGLNPSTAFLNADGVSAVLSFINKDADAQVLSEPRAVTLDNEEAVLSVTRAFPIFKNTAGTQGSPGGSEVSYTNLGTILHVTPRISAEDFINLKVKPEVSSRGETLRKIVSGTVNEADVYDIRKIETEVMIPSGNTLVLGGLVSDDRVKAYSKVPLLGDIPLVGLAFRHESKQQTKKNLIIFITPTIVRDTDFQPTKTEYLQTKALMPAEVKETAWDSAKPHDWSQQQSDFAPEFSDPSK